MHQKCVCKPGKSLAGIFVFSGDGFLAQVAAGHHQDIGRLFSCRTGQPLEKQVVKRCIWKHHAQGILPGSYLF
jgi:hypothetical protein